MKVCINKEEWYPVFVIRDPDEYPSLNVDIPEEIFYEYKSVLEDFDSIQSKLAEFLELNRV